MTIIEFFKIYGEMIIGLTLMLLLATYWILIYRLHKLEETMRKFDKRFVALEDLFKSVKENIVLIVDKMKHLEVLKTAVIKFSATTPIGPVDAEISLAKLLEKKADAAPTENKSEEKSA